MSQQVHRFVQFAHTQVSQPADSMPAFGGQRRQGVQLAVALDRHDCQTPAGGDGFGARLGPGILLDRPLAFGESLPGVGQVRQLSRGGNDP